jgi:hypothetical protein
MIMYNFSPPVYHPRMSQAIVAPAVVPSSAGPMGAPVPEGLFWTALAAGASWAAIQTGMRKSEKTFTRVAGWSGGVAAGLAALIGLAGVLAPSAARTFPVRWYWTA